ncbi:MAG: hypothetical protein HQK53_17360, partial [Oligoflexia bacterium]|nr:hypothetical protein [Oligoflexia bacterium]
MNEKELPKSLDLVLSNSSKTANHSAIVVNNARVHNLKSVSISIPKNTLTVITGPSGSGKSSLAFDTIYAEGQRRYIESLSSYARQFLEQYAAPDVDSITGLSPTLAIDQKTVNKNPRSTVGTITEIYDYLRILYTKIGVLFCPCCGEKIECQSAEQIVNSIMAFPSGSKIQILAPVVRSRKGEHREELSKLLAMGFSRIRVDGVVQNLREGGSAGEVDGARTVAIKGVLQEKDVKQNIANKNVAHNVEVIVDRIVLKDETERLVKRSRLTDSVEQALRIGDGTMIVMWSVDQSSDSEEMSHHIYEKFYNEKSACLRCGISFPELVPNSFSFNSPLGACSVCGGLGVMKDFQNDLIITDSSLSINQWGIPLLKRHIFMLKMIACIADAEGINLDLPIKKLPKKFIGTVLNGSKKVYRFSFMTENSSFNFTRPFIGLHPWLHKRYYETTSEKVRSELQRYLSTEKCKSCGGKRLNPQALSTKISGISIIDFCE